MAKELKKHYSARELSAFCLQISLLLRAAIPLDEGLSVMAEDAADEEEKKILLHMSEEVELGSPFSVVLEQVGSYPSYVIRMAKLGEETGTLDQMMASLSEYYEKEYILMKSIKNAVTYPVIMIFMLLVVLFVLFTKVMPIFESVYEQLGARLSLYPWRRRDWGAYSAEWLLLQGFFWPRRLSLSGSWEEAAKRYRRLSA